MGQVLDNAKKKSEKLTISGIYFRFYTLALSDQYRKFRVTLLQSHILCLNKIPEKLNKKYLLRPNNMLSRKRLVSTDTVCYDFVRQSWYWQKPYSTWNLFNFVQMWTFSTKQSENIPLFSSKLHKGVNIKNSNFKTQKSVKSPSDDFWQYRRKISYLLHV